MARKKQSLTPEEKLARALVPQDQQPYKLPKGWVWTRLGNINFFKNKTLTPKQFPDEAFEMYSVPSFSDNYPEIVNGSEIGSSKQLVEKDDVLLCKINPRINRVWKVYQYTKHQQLASSEWIVVRNHAILSDYLMWYFRCSYFREYMLSNVSGVGGSLMRAQPKFVKTYPVPLPPLPKQQRIVARIESLFAKLDAARDKLQQVLDTQEARRAAILHEAFTGRLTGHKGSAEGRGKREEEGAQNPEGTEFVPEGWKKVKLTEVCAINPKKISTKELDNSLKVSFFPMASLDDRLGKITKPEIRTLSEVKKGFTNFSEADVVLAKITPCFENGKAAIMGPLMNHIGYDTTEFFVLRSTQDLYNKFLFYFIRSPKFRSEAKAHMTGAVGQQRVPKDFVENYSFMLPPLEEQCRIVDILDSLLNKEYQASTIAQSSLSQIDLLKKSILARAFRGQLGTQDPSDPDARDLLTSDQ